MTKWREWLMAMRQEDRIEAAIYALEEITGMHSNQTMAVMKKHKLTRSEAQIVLVLNAANGRPVSKASLYEALYPHGGDAEEKIIDVFICKARKKGMKIRTVWGVGYFLEDRLDLSEGPPIEITMTVRRRVHEARDNIKGMPWSKEDDDYLEMMVSNNWEIWQMADELSRSERSISDRIRRNGLK